MLKRLAVDRKPVFDQCQTDARSNLGLKVRLPAPEIIVYMDYRNSSCFCAALKLDQTARHRQRAGEKLISARKLAVIDHVNQ